MVQGIEIRVQHDCLGSYGGFPRGNQALKLMYVYFELRAVVNPEYFLRQTIFGPRLAVYLN